MAFFVAVFCSNKPEFKQINKNSRYIRSTFVKFYLFNSRMSCAPDHSKNKTNNVQKSLNHSAARI